jgi:endonuclease/exonuclease/phosphatase family metal-dependent hydrolase
VTALPRRLRPGPVSPTAILVGAAIAFAAAALPLRGGTVSGTVVDAQSRPVPRARVLLSGTVGGSALTDQTGEFAFGGLGAGTYQVRIDAQGFAVLPAPARTFSLGVDSAVTVRFALVVGPIASIPSIQGRGHLSPRNREELTSVPGVVTAIRGGLGFYMQNPSPDADDGTSEGILVTGSRLPAVRPGDLVLVDGYVQEYYDRGADAGDLSVTRLRASGVRTLMAGVELPEPVVLGERGRRVPDLVICDDASGNAEASVFDPENDGIDFFESLEGMLVQVNEAVVVGSVHTSYGEFQVVGDGGRLASIMTRRGGLLLGAGDQNPERITVDVRAAPDLVTQPIPPVIVGDRFAAPIVGPLDYSFSDYKILPIAALPRFIRALLPRERAPDARGPATLTVATLNVENFSAQSGPEKVQDLAETVAHALGSPDILALQEVQDDSGSRNDGTTSAARTYGVLIDAVARAGGPRYEYREIPPEDNRDGGEEGGNIRVGLLYNPVRVRFVDRAIDPQVGVGVRAEGGRAILTGSPGRVAPEHRSMVGSRKPLACEVEFAGRRLFLVVVHLVSKSGDAQVYARSHPVPVTSERIRTEQAQQIHTFVASILDAEPDAAVVVLGDCNELTFAPPMLALKGDTLVDLAEKLLPPEERYTYLYRGNSEDLDHILVSRFLWEQASSRLWIPHRYAEYLYGDRQTDHDPVLAAFTFPAAGAAKDATR